MTPKAAESCFYVGAGGGTDHPREHRRWGSQVVVNEGRHMGSKLPPPRDSFSPPLNPLQEAEVVTGGG